MTCGSSFPSPKNILTIWIYILLALLQKDAFVWKRPYFWRNQIVYSKPEKVGFQKYKNKDKSFSTSEEYYFSGIVKWDFVLELQPLLQQTAYECLMY